MNARALAILSLGLLAGACRPGEQLAPRPEPPAGLPAEEPVVRIGITVDSAAAHVGATGAFVIRPTGGEAIARGSAGQVWTFTSDADGRLTARSPDGASHSHSGSLLIVPVTPGTLRIGDRRYRGEALITPRANGRVTAANVVELEAYLLGVVPREMGRRPASEIEALKAQAIAARTYSVGNLGNRSDRGFDFFATIQDQVYGGMADEDSIVSRAVRETSGEILTYDGQPIVAYYSSTCGGATASIEDSWPWQAPQPYLRSVSDRIPGTDDHYCSWSSRFTWTTRWTRDQLREVLAQTLRAHTRGAVTTVNRVDDVRISAHNPSDRATVSLTADGREYTLRADSVRWVLRPEPGPAILNSSRLYSLETEPGAGGVESLEISGGGWGHAIGMCQVGAMGRARAGHGYSQILRAYYTGVEITKLY